MTTEEPSAGFSSHQSQLLGETLKVDKEPSHVAVQVPILFAAFCETRAEGE